jgi:hypothetical protein
VAEETDRENGKYGDMEMRQTTLPAGGAGMIVSPSPLLPISPLLRHGESRKTERKSGFIGIPPPLLTKTAARYHESV